jgi:hypothetical protein
MKTLIPVLVVVLAISLLAGDLLAGGTPMTSKGDKQLVFQFKGLSWLGLEPYFRGAKFCEFCGDEDCIDADCYACDGGIGLRYFLNDDTAIRTGVNIAWGSDTWTDPDYDEDGEVSCLEFGVSVLYEKYLPHIHSIAPYVGVGLGYTHSTYDYKQPRPSECADMKTELSGSFLDVMGAAGFQWYFTEAISLGGEYRGAFTYASAKCEDTDCEGETDTPWEATAKTFNWDTASLFLSVHF